MNIHAERSSVSALISQTTLPNMIPVQQHFPRPRILEEDIASVVRSEIRPQLSQVQPGMQIAITAGSRQIRNFPLILRTIVEELHYVGAKPFIVPAMGSHGGACVSGQLATLAGLGITEASIGCPIHATTDVVQIATLPDQRPVYINRYAAQADGIIVACRVKPHTGFRGTYESGIMKMMAIGLGNPAGADICHCQGVGKLAENIVSFGTAILQHSRILFAIAVLENAYDETYRITAVQKNDIVDTEPVLLQDAFLHMPRIWAEECDVLVVDQIGKNFSGDGMDPNITGTFCTPYASGGIRSKAVTILGISDAAHGNGVGIGSAVAVPKQMVEKLDLESMYINSITSTVLTTVRIPMIMQNQQECIQVALRACPGIPSNQARIIRISNTLQMEHIWMSEAYLPQIQENPNLTIEAPPQAWPFDKNGNLF